MIKGKTHAVLVTNIYREVETPVLPMRHEDNAGWKTGRRKRARLRTYASINEPTRDSRYRFEIVAR
jgi:hypothetical protein